jgi:hypothetical protein
MARANQRQNRRHQSAATVLQLGDIDLTGEANRGGGEQQAEQHRARVAHEHSCRKEVVRQEAEAGAGDRDSDQTRGRRSGQALVTVSK